MEKKILFSKKGIVISKKDTLDLQVRRRVYQLLYKLENESRDNYINDVHYDMLTEHGWTVLGSTDEVHDHFKENAIEDFIMCCEDQYLFAIIELFYDIYLSYQANYENSLQDVFKFNSEINRIFKESKLPWRLLDGRIVKISSTWIENEIIEKACELIREPEFSVALDEFLKAEDYLMRGEYQNCILYSAKSYESVLKVIVKGQDMNARRLVEELKELEIIPNYHEEFHGAFYDHVLSSVSKIRNKEHTSHGAGSEHVDIPECLAQLALHLTAVLILYIIKKYKDKPNTQKDKLSDQEQR